MSTSSDAQSAFARHSLGEQSRQQQEQQQPSTGPNKDAHPLGQMSFTARLLVFILIPTFTGLMGLFTSYMQSRYVPAENEKDDKGNPLQQHEVDFDQDFLAPFLLAMALVVVLGFQTRGYATKERDYFVQWPKARKIKKIRRERVIVDDVIAEDEGGEEKEKDEKSKKDE